MEEMDRLAAVMARLREPGGCPWDREQDYASLRKYVLEEAYEVAEALDRISTSGDRAAAAELRGELGDLLFQVVFLARLAEEQGLFELRDVARGIAEKMERRHPHVFGDARAETPEEVWTRWEDIKATERDGGSLFEGIPRALPGLLKARHLTAKAARVGFDWARDEDVLEKLEEETEEYRRAAAAGTEAELEHEIGDMLFVVVNLARRHEIDPERALQGANRRFERRFRYIEDQLREEGRSPREAGLEEMDRLWEEAKGATGAD
jgi:tetrapyrrole methylase family protein/MazG family protein/ATP diphosphatase